MKKVIEFTRDYYTHKATMVKPTIKLYNKPKYPSVNKNESKINKNGINAVSSPRCLVLNPDIIALRNAMIDSSDSDSE